MKRDKGEWNSTNSIGEELDDNDAFALCRAMLVIAMGQLGVTRLDAGWARMNKNYYAGKDLGIEHDERGAAVFIETTPQSERQDEEKENPSGAELGEEASGEGPADGRAESDTPEA
jgi:hypothetical protein